MVEIDSNNIIPIVFAALVILALMLGIEADKPVLPKHAEEDHTKPAD